MTTVGFIGLGIMGKPMARNLSRAGYELVVHNRSRGPVDELVAEGAVAGLSPADVARRADVVFYCLSDGPDVQAVTLGPDGVAEAARDGLLVIDCSTINPGMAQSVASALGGAGVQVVDAPVSGGDQGAIDGALSIMVGGTDEAFAAAQPYLAAVGETVIHVGGAGAGQTVKAANQLLVGGIIGLVSEAILLLEAHDVDIAAARDVLSAGLAGNRILDRKAEAMAQRSFVPGFRIELHDKDMGIVSAIARDKGVPMPLTSIVTQLMTAANAAGDGDLDHGGLLRSIERLVGRNGENPHG